MLFRPMRSTARSPKAALLLGFGGVIFLLTILGLDMLRVLAEMQSANETIRRDFFVRERQLTDIRSALYLSGTYVRDYLLDPNPEAAERHRTSLLPVRKTVTDEVAAYEKLIRTEQRGPFHAFEQELRAYWKSLAPVFVWCHTSDGEMAMRSYVTKSYRGGPAC